MKISKRESYILSVLLILIVGVVYYYYRYTPQQLVISDLKIEQENVSKKRQEAETFLNKQKMLEQEITENKKKITALSEKYSSDVKQEDEIMTINNLMSTSAIQINSMSFAYGDTNLKNLAVESLEKIGYVIDPNANANSQGVLDITKFVNANISTEPIDASSLVQMASKADVTDAEMVKSLTMNLAYTGTYEDLEKFLYSVYGHSKYILMDSITLSPSQDGTLSGNISLTMNALPNISDVLKYNDPGYFVDQSSKESIADVFTVENIYAQSIVQETLEADVVERVKTIFGFETNDYFFVGSNDGVEGKISRVSTTKLQGNYAALLEYQFMDKSEDNYANLVFDKNPILVNEPTRSLELPIYTEGEFINQLGMVIVDEFGQEYDILASISAYIPDYSDEERKSDPELLKTKYKGWKLASIGVPNSITGTFMIERIYIHPTGIQQQLTGKVILDNLCLVKILE